MQEDHADPGAAGRLHHLELCVSDLEVALPFWAWLLGELGYDPKDRWDGGRSWELGPTYVVVKRAAVPEHGFERRGPGLDHVAFHAPSRPAVDELAEAVRDRPDATLLYPERHPYAGGYYALFCEAPDGIVVEVVGPAPTDARSVTRS